MPEGPEVETERLHEAIREEVEEEVERAGGAFVRAIALTTAVLAALAAVASLRAGGTVNEALALKTEATRLQAEASDQWAYYQAKGVKAAVQESIGSMYAAAGKPAPEQVAERARRYAEEQEKIAEVARDKETERDAREAEATHLLHAHHRWAIGVALFQVAIALGAIAALTRIRAVWFGSVAVGAAGIACVVAALLA